jgi:hypothetical protein
MVGKVKGLARFASKKFSAKPQAKPQGENPSQIGKA